PYQVLNPLSYDASECSFVVIGGGELLRSKGDPYYDRFRLRGSHVLVAAGSHHPDNLDYLNEYQFVTVRSEHDAAMVRPSVGSVEVLPCVSTLMPRLFATAQSGVRRQAGAPVRGQTGVLGVHLHYGTLAGVPGITAALEELARRWKLVFVPFTRYNADFELM